MKLLAALICAGASISVAQTPLMDVRKRLALVRQYEKNDDWWNVIEQLQQLRKLAPNEPEYAYQLGTAYKHMSKWAFDRMQTVAPQSARVQLMLGEQYSVAGEHDKAESAFLKAIAADPKLEGSHLALAIVYLQTGKRDQALSETNKELAVAPESAVAKQVRQAIFEKQ